MTALTVLSAFPARARAAPRIFGWRAQRVAAERRAGSRRHAYCARCDLLQQPNPFTSNCGLVGREAGDVAARMRKAQAEAAANRIGYQSVRFSVGYFGRRQGLNNRLAIRSGILLL